jgi:hypothetical protein
MFNFNQEIRDLVAEKAYACLQIDYSKSNSSKISCRCFMCGDSKKDVNVKRGYIYLPMGDKPNYHCWNEGCTATGIDLLSKIQGLTYKESFSQVIKKYRDRDSCGFDADFIIDDDNDEDEVFINESVKPKMTTMQSINIPDDWKPLSEDAQKVITNREIHNAPFAPKNWKLYLSKRTNRIVIPWIKDNEIVGYQLRALTKGQQPKYLFEKGQKKRIFYSGYFQDDFPYVFSGEGVFDMIFIPNGCAVGGIIPTNGQREELKNRYPFHDIVYMLDNPWHDTASYNKILELGKKSPNQKVFLWDKKIKAKDINEDVISSSNVHKYTTEYLTKRIITASKASIYLKFGKSLF